MTLWATCLWRVFSFWSCPSAEDQEAPAHKDSHWQQDVTAWTTELYTRPLFCCQLFAEWLSSRWWLDWSMRVGHAARVVTFTLTTPLAPSLSHREQNQSRLKYFPSFKYRYTHTQTHTQFSGLVAWFTCFTRRAMCVKAVCHDTNQGVLLRKVLPRASELCEMVVWWESVCAFLCWQTEECSGPWGQCLNWPVSDVLMAVWTENECLIAMVTTAQSTC